MAGGIESRDLVMKLRVDLGDAEAQLRRLQQQYDALGKGGFGGGGGTPGGGSIPSPSAATAGYEGLSKAALAASAAIAAAAGAAVYATAEMLKLGEQVVNVSDSFQTLQGGTAAGAAAALEGLRTATSGLISDFELMKTANQGALLGLDPRTFDELALSATRLGQAVGRDATSSINDLILGLSRGSPRILDNIGIVVKAETAYQKFAAANDLVAKELSEGEKKLAVQAEAVEQARAKYEQLGPAAHNAATEFHQLGADLENLKNGFASAIANSETLESFLRGVGIVASDVGYALRYLFSSDTETKLVKLQQAIDTYRAQGDLVNRGVKSSDLADRAQAEYDAIADKIKGEQLLAKFRLANDQDAARGAMIREGDEERARKAAEAAAKAREAAAKRERAEQERLTETIEKQVIAFEKLGEKSDVNSLDKALKKSIDELNQADFSRLSQEYEAALTTATRNSLEDQYKEAIAAGKITAEEVEKYSTDLAKSKVAERADDYREAMIKANEEIQRQLDESFQESFDGFSELIGSAIDGDIGSIEDTLKSMFKRTAVGFAAQIAASIAAENGLGFLGKLFGSGDAGGFGQSLAASLGFEGGGVKKIGDLLNDAPLLHSATALDGSAAALLNAAQALSGAALGKSGSYGSLSASDVVDFGSTFINSGYNSGDYGSAAASGATEFGSSFLQGSGDYGAAAGSGLVDSGTSALGQSGTSYGDLLGYAGAAYQGYNLYQNYDKLDSEMKGTKISQQIGLMVANAYTFGLASVAESLGRKYIPDQLAAIDKLDAKTNPLSILLNAILGGDSQKAFEREQRAALNDSLLTAFGQEGKADNPFFQGFGGQITFDDKNFNVDQSKGFNSQISALVNPLADLFTGGDEKLSSDLAGIFTNGLGDAESFNEALLNAQTLMDKLGYSAEEAKSGVTELFLDGSLSLQDFGTDLQAINLLATDGLPGLADVNGAIELLTANLDDDSRRQALKALEIAFKEMAEAGIDSTAEIHDYILANFGPDIAKVFDKLGELGVDSFDDLKNIGGDALFALFGELGNLKGTLDATATSGANAGDGTAQGMNRATAATQKATSALKDYNKELEAAIKKSKELSFGGGGSGGGSSPSGGGPNQDLDDFGR